MFASDWIVPFDAEPVSRRAADIANVSDSAEGSIVGEALADVVCAVLRHFVSFLRATFASEILFEGGGWLSSRYVLLDSSGFRSGEQR